MIGNRLVRGAVYLAICVFATGCREKNEPLRPLVIVEKPAKEDVQIFGEYVGRIKAASFVEIHARVEGYLEKMLFVEGKEVKQNEPLFIINSALYKAKVEKAKAQLKKNEAQAAKARRDVERLRPLYEQHAASQLDLDNALAALDDAEADIAMSRADLDQAQLELSYTTVTSPLSGYISERFVDIGALVGPGVNSKLAEVVKSDTVQVDFQMTALDYLRAERRNVKFGVQDTSRSWQPTVTVTLADDSEYPVKGIVDFADPQVDPQTGTFGVRAELPNPNRKLLPGQFTKVKLLLDVRERAIVVPRKAISIEKGGAFIYVVQNKNIRKMAVLCKQNKFNHPIFYDLDGEMDKINKLHKNEEYRCFLLDQDNRIKVLGNPINNLAIKEMYQNFFLKGDAHAL